MVQAAGVEATQGATPFRWMGRSALLRARHRSAFSLFPPSLHRLAITSELSHIGRIPRSEGPQIVKPNIPGPGIHSVEARGIRIVQKLNAIKLVGSVYWGISPRDHRERNSR